MGSGKSLFVELFSKKLGYKAMDGGTIRRQMAKEHGMSIEEFSVYSAKLPELDHETDARLIAVAKKGRVVMQSRVLPYTKEARSIPGVYFLYLAASKKVRAQRIAKREGISQAQATKNIEIRDTADIKRFKKVYGIDTKDLSVYDLVVNNSRLTPSETVKFVLSKLKEVKKS